MLAPDEEPDARLIEEWDRLAEVGGSPFLTWEWLSAWWRAFGSGELVRVLLEDGGRLRAGVFLRRAGRRLVATANPHSGDWDAVADDDAAREELWREVARLAPGTIVLSHLPSHGTSLEVTRATLRRTGFRSVPAPGPLSPYRELPDTYDELLASVSRDLRQQVGRRTRGLEREGELGFREVRGGDELDAELERVFEVEGSGWKARSGTAIASTPVTAALYREFALVAARRGWLRLYLLELDGSAIAVDYGCAFAGGGFLIKTGFLENYGRLSPGLVLRAKVLEASIAEGLSFYDFLGGPDAYKLRWADTTRPRVALRAYRGLAGLPGFAYRAGLRPVLKRARDGVRARLARRAPS